MTPPREGLTDYEKIAADLYTKYGNSGLLPYEIAAALRAAEASALELAAQVAKQSQEDCFCRDKADALTGGMPCTACMEAARIEGTLHGLAHRLAPPPESPPAKEPCRAEVASRFPEYSHYECELPGGHVGPHSEGGTEWTDATTVVAPPSEPVAPAPSAAEKRIAELEAALRSVEWILPPQGENPAYCLSCGGAKPHHVPGCLIDAALAHTASPGKGEG